VSEDGSHVLIRSLLGQNNKKNTGTPCYMAGLEDGLFWIINTQIASFQLVMFKEYVEKD
jgi:hypothetical protein